MEQKFDSSEEKLFDLSETKNFEELTASERTFVLTHLSEESYRTRRNILVQSKKAFDEKEVFMPLPLQFTQHKTLMAYRKKVTVYQLMLSVAAVIILFLLVVPYLSDTEKIPEERIVVQHDTVTVEKEIYDTVVIEKEIPRVMKEKVYVQNQNFDNCEQEELRLLEVQEVNPIPIEGLFIEKTGTSMSQDETKILISAFNIEKDFLGR